MGLGAAIRRFRRGEHGGVAIESAIAMVILVVAFAGLIEIAQASYAGDRMARAARTAARVLALNPSADACSAIQRELDLAEDFECETAWRLIVELGVSPNSLPPPWATARRKVPATWSWSGSDGIAKPFHSAGTGMKRTTPKS